MFIPLKCFLFQTTFYLRGPSNLNVYYHQLLPAPHLSSAPQVLTPPTPQSLTPLPLPPHVLHPSPEPEAWASPHRRAGTLLHLGRGVRDHAGLRWLTGSSCTTAVSSPASPSQSSTAHFPTKLEAESPTTSHFTPVSNECSVVCWFPAERWLTHPDGRGRLPSYGPTCLLGLLHFISLNMSTSVL